MYYLIPNHTTPGKRTVTLYIYPKKDVQGYRLKIGRERGESFVDGCSFAITKNGSYEVEVKMGSGAIATIQFTIAFLSDKSEFGGGDGSADDPYQVATIGQLNAIRLNLGAHYVLTEDIDMSQWGIVWIPIGRYAPQKETLDATKAFHGTLDGANHKLLHLHCQAISEGLIHNKPAVQLTGLFGCCIGATLQNLYLESCQIYGEVGAGCLFGEAQDCVLKSCHASGLVQGISSIGGLAGGGLNCQFEQCSFDGAVFAKFDASGLCCEASTICNCEVNASISALSPTGICSNTTTIIEHCIVRGVLTGSYEMSGICCSAGEDTKVIGCICALERVMIKTPDAFSDELSGETLYDSGKRLFSDIDRQMWADTQYEFNFSKSTLAYSRARDWERFDKMDGTLITDEQLKNCTFLEAASWNFNGCWQMSDQGPILRGDIHPSLQP